MPRRHDGIVVARYSWLVAPERQAGRLRLTPGEDGIEHLVVTFEEG